jgi:methanethiol S-methyltransferase
MEVDVVSLALYCLFFLVLSLKGIRGRGRWRQRGMITGFIVALFTEMWGFPLSFFIITSLGGGTTLPYQFDNLMYYFTQIRNASDVAFFNPPPAWLAEYVLARGVTLLSLLPIINGWFFLKRNLDRGLIINGPYRFSRNPQYIGFILFVVGMTLYWPTLITIPMACVLFFAYYKLALSEEKNLAENFTAEYADYSRKVPRFLGKHTYKIFQLPKKLNLTEKVVAAALLIPFVLWFAEAVASAMLGTEVVRMYWFPVAYLFPIHFGVVISLVLLLPLGAASTLKYLVKRKRTRKKETERKATSV